MTSHEPPMPTTDFQLVRTPFGELVWTGPQGQQVSGVVPVRAFPIQAPQDGISLVDPEGHEVAWFAQLAEIPQSARALIEEELARREFMPMIQRIAAVSGFSTPCTWTVDTDRGRTEFVLRGDEDIRRIGSARALLIADAHGINYLVPDHFALDAHSKRVLDRFL
jgi:hypothetical protein